MNDSEGLAIRLREKSRNPAHVRVGVFIGRTEGSRGASGELVIRTDEWDALLRGKVRRMATWGPWAGGDDPNEVQVWFHEATNQSSTTEEEGL